MRTFEQKIIGGVVAGTVKPSSVNLDGVDFEDAELGTALTVAKQMETEGVAIDADILQSRLSEKDFGFLSAKDFRLMAQTAQSASIVFDAIDKVKSSALKTFLLSQTANLALQEKSSGAEILDKLKNLVNQADKFYRSSENNFVFLKEIAPKVKAVYQDLYSGISYAVPTYFPLIDAKLLDGFSKGDLHLIVGMTGAGKSALALNFALNQAKNNHVVGVVSREMSDIENVMRLQAADAEIPRWQIKKEMFPGTFDRLNAHLDHFSDLPIAFNTRTEDVQTLRNETILMVENHGLEILYVDYLQLMASTENADTRANEVQTISRELKKLAMELKIPIVALCQFNNGVMNASLFDVMNYIRESGSIKQDASTIQYIQVEQVEHRAGVPSPEFKDAKNTILKNRNGETFNPVDLRFKGAEFQFYEA